MCSETSDKLKNISPYKKQQNIFNIKTKQNE